MKRRVFLGLPVILGILFYIWYIFHASDNVAYSDYIRLVNSYLPDVTNPAKFFVPDILTRVPITYLGRIINVKLFGYNTYFDMILGVLSLGAGAAVLALYAERNRSVGYLSFLLIQFVYFSLNKWEMMTNGTGWVCTLSISGFLFHFAVLDHAAATRCRNMSDRVLLAILPILLVVLVAGPYSGGYAVILVLAYGALWLADRRGGNKQPLLEPKVPENLVHWGIDNGSCDGIISLEQFTGSLRAPWSSDGCFNRSGICRPAALFPAVSAESGGIVGDWRGADSGAGGRKPLVCPAASGVSAGAGSVCFVSAGTVSECAVSAL